MSSLYETTSFDWDEGNSEKNWIRHRVKQSECEQVFFNRPFVVRSDALHSDTEDRYFSLGQTDRGRRLFVVFTMRDDRIRIISARAMTPKERRRYEHAAAEEADSGL